MKVFSFERTIKIRGLVIMTVGCNWQVGTLEGQKLAKGYTPKMPQNMEEFRNWEKINVLEVI